MSPEEVKRAFKDYELSRKRLKLFTGIDYQKLYHILKFARIHGRITPAQKRDLERILAGLKSTEGIDFSIPAEVLERFLKEVKVKTEGAKGK